MLTAKSHNQNSKYQNWDFSCCAHCLYVNVFKLAQLLHKLSWSDMAPPSEKLRVEWLFLWERASSADQD